MDAELHKELSSIQNKLDQCVSALPLIQKHEKMLFGDEEVDGMKVRLDRVEQKAKTNKWLASVALGGFLTAVGEWFAKKLWS